MHRKPLLCVFLAAVAGVWLVETFAVPDWVAGGGAALAGIGLWWSVRRRRGVVVAAWLLAGAAVGWGRAATGPPRPPPSCAVPAGIRGYAVSLWRVRVDGPVEVRRAGMRTAVELMAEHCGGVWIARRGRVAVTLWEGPWVRRGDVLEVSLAVEPLPRARNAIDADAAVQGGIDGVDASARVQSVHRLVARENGVLAMVDAARRVAGDALSARLSEEAAAVARGLVMGDRGGLGAADREAWADAGLAHLLAVSGMHVTMVVVVIGFAVKELLGRVSGVVERWSLLAASALVALPAAVLFCLWSASPASAVRATVMGGVGLVGTILGRPARAVEALAFTGLAMLVEQPLLLHDAGFGLSMAAVAALLASPRLATDEAELLQRPLWRMVLKAKRMFLLGVVASVSATLAALPITVVFFGRVSLVAPLTNIVAVPLGATLATPLALALVAVAPVAPRCADVLAVPLEILLRWLLAIVHLGERLPGAAVALAAPATHELACYVAVLGFGFAALRRKRKRVGLVLACGVAALVLGVSVLARWWADRRRDELVVTMPYVGQGDGIILRFPGGQTALVDAGGAITTSDWDPGRQVIAPLLRKRGVRAIDLVVVSHPHPDHIGGLVYVAGRFPIAELWRSGQPDEGGVLAALESLVTARGGRLRLSSELPVSVVYGGARIDVIHPRVAETSYFPELELNDNSVVLRVTHGARSILLTGDIEAIAERELAASGVDLRADVLKVAHHGSRTSSTSELLDAVRPKLAVASCGAHNQFGFPHPEVVQRLAERNVPFLTTAERGAITLRTDGVTWRVSAHRPGFVLTTSDVLESVLDGD